MKKIFIGSLIRNCDWILEDFLKRIKELNYDKKKITLCFILNDSIDNSEKTLHEFAKNNAKEYERIIITNKDFGDKSIGAGSSRLNESDPLGRNYGSAENDRMKLYYNLSVLRNLMIKIFTEKSDSEYMISIDSDILVYPETINLLTDSKIPCMRGAMVINDWLINPDMGFNPLYRRCNVGNKNEQGSIKHLVAYELDKIYKVDVTGACFAIHRDIVKKSFYKFHLWGEDAGYCVDMPDDVVIEWDTRCNPFHVMEQTMLIQEPEYLKALKDVKNV